MIIKSFKHKSIICYYFFWSEVYKQDVWIEFAQLSGLINVHAIYIIYYISKYLPIIYVSTSKVLDLGAWIIQPFFHRMVKTSPNILALGASALICSYPRIIRNNSVVFWCLLSNCLLMRVEQMD